MAPITRRGLIVGAVALAAMPSAHALAQDSTPDPAEVQPEGDPAAVELLRRSAAAMTALSSFAFEMETVQGSSTILVGIELQSVEGVVRRPMDLDVTVTAKMPMGTMTMGAIGIDGELYFQDPMQGGNWVSMGAMPELSSMLNPDWLIQLAVRQVHDAKIIGQEDVDGTETRVVEGVVDLSNWTGVAREVGGDDAQEYLSGTPVDVTFWIDQQGRVLELEIFGPIMATESADVTKVIRISDFDEPVEIEKPDVVSTPTT